MQKKFKKIAAVVVALITAFSPSASALSVWADDNDDIEIVPSGQSEIVVQAEAEDMQLPEAAKGKVSISLDGKGGSLEVIVGDSETSFRVDEEGNVKSTDKNGQAADVEVSKDGYILVLEEANGTVVHTKAVADDGFNVATYSVQTDSGAEQELKEAASEVSYDIKVKGEKVLKVGFEENAVDIEETESKSLEELAEEAGIPAFSLTPAEEDAWRTFCSLTGVSFDDFYASMELDYYKKAVSTSDADAEELVGLAGDTVAGVDRSVTKSIIYTEGEWLPYGSHGTFVRSGNNGSHNATCIMPNLPSISSGTFTAYKITNPTLRGLMWFAPGAYGYEHCAEARAAYRNLTGTDDWTQHYILWHLAMSFAYNTICQNENGVSDSSWTGGAGDTWVQRAQSYAYYSDHTLHNVLPCPDDFQCWIFVTSSGTQPIATYEPYTPTSTPTPTPTPLPGSVKLIKKTEKGYEDMVKNNPCYDITGTTYELYRQADNQKVGTLKVKADGTSNVINNLPAGSYYAVETEAGHGYKIKKDHIRVELKPGQDYTITAYDIPANDPIGIELTKIDADTNKTVEKEGAEFTVKYYAVNIYEDTYNTVAELENATGGATRTWVMAYNKDEETGKWGASFGTLIADRSDPVYYDENGNPAVPHGYITIEETKAPDGYSLIGKTIEGTEDRYKVDNGVLISKVYSNHIQAGNVATAADHKIEIGTQATDATTNSQQMANAERDITVNDVVSYAGLTPGKTYTAVGRLVNEKEETITDKDGKEVTATKEFTPESTDGTVTVTFKFTLSDKQAEALTGKKIVAFEEIQDNGTTIASHTDINDEAQTIFVPKVETEATDNGAHVAMGHKNQTIVDKVTCSNLIVGKKYKVSGVLMTVDDEGKETKLLIDGQEVTAETEEFTAEKATEIKELAFTFDGSSLVMGKTVVAFETLTTEGIKIAVHADINDKNQTVWYPNIKTTAKDANTKSDMASIDEDGNIKLVDTISYKDVEPGATYKLTGYVVDKKTGKAVTQEVSKEFTAAETAGKETMSFTVKSEDVAESNALVVFEKMFLIKSTLSENVPTDPVAVHEDINDVGQTVLVPGIETTLVADAETKSKDVEIKNPIALTDIVKYDGLIVGKEYTLTGTIMDKATGTALLDKDGKEVTATKSFTPETESGEAEVEFTIDLTDEQLKALAGNSIVAFETLTQDGLTLAAHADINDEDQTIDFPKVKTEAKDVETQTQNSYADEDITIVDKVTCENLTVGKDYTVSGTLMTVDENGKETELLVNGKPVTAETEFRAEKATGEAELTFKFSGVGLEGKKVVVFEDLYTEKIKVAVHADIKDKDQTVWIPKIGTTARDAETKIQNAEAAKDQKLIDTVAYENLLPETDYMLVTKLMDKTTGKAVMNDGKEVTATMTFKTGAAKEGEYVVSGTVDAEITFDATGLENHTVVVFERAYLVTPETSENTLDEKKVVAAHEDINDVEQSIFIPEIRTHAKDLASDTKASLPSGVQTISDRVTYKNLLPEKEYTLTGQLVDKQTGEPVTLAEADVADSEDGKVSGLADSSTETPVPSDESVADTAIADNAEAPAAKGTTKTMTFKTPAAKEGETTVSGEVVIEFKVNASAMAGKTLVAFEKVEYLGRELAIHADITDEEQTVYYPKIGTKLVDKADKDKLVLADKKAVVVDTLEYKNLVPGDKYKAVATLMDKSTKKALLVNDKPVTAEKEFTADKSGNGTVAIEIPFDASKLANSTLVAFEKVYTLGTNVEIAHHEDIEDEGQTVYVPEIGTKLVNKADSGKLVYAGQTTVVDTVAYKNLIKGEEYKAVAKLIDKETGKAITVNGKEVTGEKTFKAEAANGKVDVEITFDASALAGHDLVCFEKVYTAKGTVECATHEDIEDKNQTVYIPKIGTVLKNKGDGGKTVTASNSVTLTDTVEYSNLVAGSKYVVKGVLKDKSTGKDLVINGKTITAEKTFTAEKESGSVTLDFTFSANGLGGKSVVAFEKVFTANGKVEVASHEDINDANQTVKFTTPPSENPKNPTTKTVQTGDDNMMAVIAISGVALLLIAAVTVFLAKRKRA